MGTEHCSYVLFIIEIYYREGTAGKLWSRLGNNRYRSKLWGDELLLEMTIRALVKITVGELQLA
jgi:hypothetical protein